MILQHVLTKEKITVTRYLYHKIFAKAPHEWKDITPEPTEKQIKNQERFVRLGMLARTKANLEQIVRTFGPHHGIFIDAIRGLDYYIREIKSS
jgi:hypothetical protein